MFTVFTLSEKKLLAFPERVGPAYLIACFSFLSCFLILSSAWTVVASSYLRACWAKDSNSVVLKAGEGDLLDLLY